MDISSAALSSPPPSFIKYSDRKARIFATSYRFSSVWGLSFDNEGDIVYVTDPDNHSVHVFDSSGAFIRSRTVGTLTYPRGVLYNTVTGDLVVACPGQRKVTLFRNGKWHRDITHIGGIVHLFSQPLGITAGPKGEIVVVDCKSHAIGIYDSEGNHLQTVEKGERNYCDVGCLHYPANVAIYVMPEEQGEQGEPGEGGEKEKEKDTGMELENENEMKVGAGKEINTDEMEIEQQHMEMNMTMNNNMNSNLNGNFNFEDANHGTKIGHSINGETKGNENGNGNGNGNENGNGIDEINPQNNVNVNSHAGQKHRIAKMFVTCDNHRVQVYDWDLVTDEIRPVAYIGTEGASDGISDGHLYRPSGIVVDRFGHVIIAELSEPDGVMGNRIQVFDLNGKFLEKIQLDELNDYKPHFNGPRTVMIKDDDLYVADFGNRRILVFEAKKK